jgi:hypothetical protein
MTSAMTLPQLIQGIGSVGVFVGRAFLPAFVTALLLRFGSQLPLIADSPVLRNIQDVPTWFTSDVTLIVLGLLAALEFATRWLPNEVKVYLDESQRYLSAGMAVLTQLGLLNATDRAVVEPLLNQADILGYIVIASIGAGTFLVSQIPRKLRGTLSESDDDDAWGLQRIARFGGDLWGAFGPVALFVFPLLSLAVFGVAIAVLALIERRLDAQAEAAKVPCSQCELPLHPSAIACPACRANAGHPRAVGILGGAQAGPADLSVLPYRLVAAKRCPVCATRFGRRAVKQVCQACGHRLMHDPTFAKAYISSIDRRVPVVCGACFVLSLIPVIGIIPGVILYRLLIVAPFRRYIPTGRGFLIRWAVRIAIVSLVALQWIPVAGGFVVPVMALINYGAYRTAYRKLAIAT